MQNLQYIKETGDRFPSQPIENPKFRGFVVGFSLFVGAFFALLLLPDWTLRWIYYEPLYALFPDNIYLPLYLKIGRNILGGVLLGCIAIPLLSKPRKMVQTICAVVFIALGFVQIGWAPAKEFRDVPFGSEDTYLTTECDLSTLCTGFLKRVGSKRSLRRYFRIDSSEQPDLVIDMDVWQYKKLLKESADKGVLKVRYAPHSERMLRIE
jgi:hypothetical protein